MSVGVLATVVDFEALGKVVAAAFIAGIGVSAVFGLAIQAGARALDLRRDGRPVASGIAGAVAALCLAAFFGAVALGLVIMTHK